MTLGDIIMAPYFDRMCVLEHYRSFKVPLDETNYDWHCWRMNVQNHDAVEVTSKSKEELIDYY